MAYDFPNAPTVGQVANGYVWDGLAWQVQGAALQGAVRFDVAQSLTANQRSQARANIDVLKKNYIINGAMMVSQEWGSTALGGSGQYPADMFGFQLVGSTGTMAFGQVGGTTPGGSPSRIRFTVTAADTSVGASDNVNVSTAIEGFRFADLKSGTAAAKTVTLQFGVKAPAGTYCVGFRNGAGNRSYVAEYVIAAGEANTDVVKSVVVPLDQSGTWDTTNGVGVYITWTLMLGGTPTSANAWVAGSFGSTANQFNFMGTVNNVFELFDVSLTEGNVAPPFVVPDYASELVACCRYWQKNYPYAVKPGTTNNAGMIVKATPNGTVPVNAPYGSITFFVPMRIAPTVTIYSYLGTSGRVANEAGTDMAANSGMANLIGDSGFNALNGSGVSLTTSNNVGFNFTANARI